MADRRWLQALIVSLLAVALWTVWVQGRFSALYETFQRTERAVRASRERTHMVYDAPNGDVVLVTPLQGEDALSYAKRARFLVNVLLQGGDPGINQKCSWWVDEKGGRITVCVTREPGETREAWCARFDAQVEAFRKVFPCQ